MKPNPGSFTPYLEYAAALSAAAAPSLAPSAALPAPPDAIAAAMPVRVRPIAILEILARQVQHALPFGDLQSLSGMDTTRFRDALKSLRDADCVAIDGPPLDEVIRLTDKGAEAASLARVA